MNLRRFRHLSITGQIMLALLLAIGTGYLLQEETALVNEYIKPFGTIFLNLLKFIVVPMVLLSIISGILSMKDVSRIGRLGIRTLAYFTLTTIVAVALGLTVSTLLRSHFPTIDIETSEDSAPFVHVTLMDQFIHFFPSNIIEPVSTTSMMQVIVIALFFGIAIVHCGEKGKMAGEIMLSFNEVVQKILSYIMTLAPVGVFCMLTPVVADNGPQVLGSYAALIAVDYLCFLLHALLVYTPCVKLLGRVSPARFFREMTPAMLFAFSSDSSVATLPVTMQCSERLGVSKETGNFVLSLGATINMDGVAIYLGVTAVFIATCCGIDLTMSQYLAIALSATVASIGTPGIPGGSLALMAMVFASAGIPVEGVAIAAGIDRIVDMARTTMSITGDASCAVIMQRFCKDESTAKHTSIS